MKDDVIVAIAMAIAEEIGSCAIAGAVDVCFSTGKCKCVLAYCKYTEKAWPRLEGLIQAEVDQRLREAGPPAPYSYSEEELPNGGKVCRIT